MDMQSLSPDINAFFVKDVAGASDYEQTVKKCSERRYWSMKPRNSHISRAAEKALDDCCYCQSYGARLRCAGCLKMVYCSAQCQRSHWKEHKKFCNKKAQN